MFLNSRRNDFLVMPSKFNNPAPRILIVTTLVLCVQAIVSPRFIVSSVSPEVPEVTRPRETKSRKSRAVKLVKCVEALHTPGSLIPYGGIA